MKPKIQIFLLSMLYCVTVLAQNGNTTKPTNSEEINITTTKTFDKNDPNVYGNKTMNFIFSDSFVIVKTNSGKQIYKVVKQRMNEYGTHFYDTTDKNGNYFEWGFRKIGNETFVYCTATGIDITFGNKF